MKQIKSFLLPSTLLSFVVLFLFSCKKEYIWDNFNGHHGNQPFAKNAMVMYWHEKASEVMEEAALNNTPPAMARYWAMVEIAVHDALNSIKPKYECFALLNEKKQSANPDAAVASAAYFAIKALGLQGSKPVDEWYNESLSLIPNGESKELGKALGQKAAEAIIANRSSDNFAEADVVGPAPDGIAPGQYRSTLPFSNDGMPKIKGLQQWGTLMKPFVTQSNSQFRPTSPYAIPSAQYETDFNEAKEKGGRQIGNTRTADETEIGMFWQEFSFNSWNRFARNIIATKNLDAWKTARLFALLNTTLIDVASGCFEAKYYYKYWRPETAIRLNDDGDPNTTGDPTWLPFITHGPNPDNPAMDIYTPPIPGYPSQPASWAAAAGEILKLCFGSDNVDIYLTSLTLPGVTRRYKSISKATQDNSLSWMYAGYYFRNACIKGEVLGKNIATYIYHHSFREK